MSQDVPITPAMGEFMVKLSQEVRRQSGINVPDDPTEYLRWELEYSNQRFQYRALAGGVLRDIGGLAPTDIAVAAKAIMKGRSVDEGHETFAARAASRGVPAVEIARLWTAVEITYRLGIDGFEVAGIPHRRLAQLMSHL